jgi:hypothetical protein
MGNSAGGGTTRVVRRLGPVVAAAAGAAVVAATVLRRRHRRPPQRSGLPRSASAAAPVLAPVTELPGATRTTAIASSAGAGAEPARSERPPGDPGRDLRPAAADAGASGSGRQPAAPGGAGTRTAMGPAPDEPWPVEPPGMTSAGSAAPAGELPPNEPAGRTAPAAAAATPDTHAGGPLGRPAGLAPRRIRDRAGLGPSRRARAVLGGVAALALVVGVGAVVASATGGDGSGSATSTGRAGDGAAAPTQATAGTVTTATTLAPVTAATAFPAAADRLTAAGTFSYTGSVSATDVSHVRPMLWLSVESAVEGQVSLAAGRLHETATTTDGRVAETVTSGPQVWGRRADNRDDLAAVPYETVPVLSDAEPATKGAVLLPSWLASAVGPADAGPDESGRRRFSATVPAAVLGAVERQRPPVDATVVLTVDAAGAPVRVEITSAPGGPTLHLVYDIAGLGAPVDIQPPA